jgi:ribosomal protein S18 acetylase RimI-like enzyme
MLIATDQLTPHQLAEVDALVLACQQVDINRIAIYRHLLENKRPMRCNFLYYHENQLIGFLRAFFFSHHTCEIALMVAPSHRRRGVASVLLKEVIPLVSGQSTEKLLFSCPHKIHDEWLLARGFIYENSEYQMTYTAKHALPQLEVDHAIRHAVESDLPLLVDMDYACFSTQNPEIGLTFHGLLCDSTCDIFVLCYQGVPVGKAHVFWHKDNARLTDIAVMPKMQGRGFGSALIIHCIQHILHTHQAKLGQAALTRITLDVETNNNTALNLYNRLGFGISNAHDYWGIRLVDFQKIM